MRFRFSESRGGGAVAEHEQGFGPHVEEQVDNAQVGHEAVARLEHLVVGHRPERGVFPLVFGADEGAAVEGVGRGLVVVGEPDAGLQVEQAADGVAQGFVEVEQIGVGPLQHGAQVVGVVFEVRAGVVGRDQCLPVQVAPVAVVAEPYVAHGGVGGVVALDGHGKGLPPVGRSDDAAVAVGLLHVVLPAVNVCLPAGVELAVVADGGEIGRREPDGGQWRGIGVHGAEFWV